MYLSDKAFSLLQYSTTIPRVIEEMIAESRCKLKASKQKAECGLELSIIPIYSYNRHLLGS